MPIQFTGKERYAESGLDYFGARYYSGAQGRFTSPDKPFADQHLSDPQSWICIHSPGKTGMPGVPLKVTTPA
jgi:hypothetical protein